MRLRKFTLSWLSGTALKQSVVARLRLHLLSLAVLFSASASAFAKDPAAAIVLFDGPKGAAYVQITGITVNGKTELRVCDGVPKIDKRAYDVLPHAQLGGATSLER